MIKKLFDFNDHRQALFRLLLLLMVVAGLFFAFYNSVQHLYFLVMLQLPFVVLSFILWLITQNQKDTPRLRFLYLLLLTAILAVILWDEQSSATMFLWCYVLSSFAYILLGASNGFFYTAVFYLYAVLVYYWHVLVGDFAYQVGDNVNVVISALLLWGATHLFEQARTQNQERLADLALKDALTGCYNRLSLADSFQDFCALSLKKHTTFSLIILDVDYFKRLNDQFGHEFGDKVLKRIADCLQQPLAKVDKLFRLGGEEFLILFAKTNRQDAFIKTQNILKQITQLSFENLDAIKISMSAGVAEFPQDGTKFEELYSLADHKMYQAKAQGRNQVVA